MGITLHNELVPGYHVKKVRPRDLRTGNSSRTTIAIRDGNGVSILEPEERLLYYNRQRELSSVEIWKYSLANPLREPRLLRQHPLPGSLAKRGALTLDGKRVALVSDVWQKAALGLIRFAD